MTPPSSHLPLKDPADILQGTREIKQIFFPNLSGLYEKRAERLNFLAQKAAEDGGEYLLFLEQMVHAQNHILKTHPLSERDFESLKPWFFSQELPPQETLQKTDGLHKTFQRLCDEIAPALPAEKAAVLEKLCANSELFALQLWHLLQGDFSNCDPAALVPLWAALSLCWAQTARHYRNEITQQLSHIPSHPACPCCGGPSAGSLVMTGAEEGLRYEQCALCETRWHKVRSICPECFQSEHLDYWSIDETEKTSIEAESCGDCQTYSKIFRLDRDPALMINPDDFASMMLDAALEEKGFKRRTLNAFALPV